MDSMNREWALRQHLALISTEAYLLLRAENEDDRISRYNALQNEINAILDLTTNQPAPNDSCHNQSIS